MTSGGSFNCGPGSCSSVRGVLRALGLARFDPALLNVGRNLVDMLIEPIAKLFVNVAFETERDLFR